MITLSGVLDFSIGNFLCLRGFANYKDLANASQGKPEIQRALISKHEEDIASFLNDGDYRFFPELILSLSLLTGQNYAEVDAFFTAIRNRQEWRKKLGDIDITVMNHRAGDKNRVVHIAFDENKKMLNRIDGNHRLSAARAVTTDLTVPYCLILCRNEIEENMYSRAIFHNINAKQIPLSLEENLKIILKNPQVFSDDKLKNDKSFGWNFYLARKTLEEVDFSYFPIINTYIKDSCHSFFVEIYAFLLEKNVVEKADTSIAKLKSQLIDIENALRESEIIATTTNIAVIGALAYYKLTDSFKYRGFLSWIKKNNIGNVAHLHIGDVINLYNEIYLHVPKKVFLARWYPSQEDSEYPNANHRIAALKEVVEELNLELTDLGTRETGTFDIREVMYHDIRECDIFIADLSGARHNVMVEVGYALRHVDTGRMIFYFQKTDKCNQVPFDVSHFQYAEIGDSRDIKTKTKNRIITILNQASDAII